MEPKVLLLLNSTLIIIISFLTDYWINISYHINNVPTQCHLTNYVYYSTLQCALQYRILITQHSNLFRQCNDLTGYKCELQSLNRFVSEGIRGNISRWGLLYAQSCSSFIWDRKWRSPACNPINDILGLGLGALGLFLLPIGIYCSRNNENTLRTAFALGASTVSFAGAVVLSLINIHQINVQQSETTMIDSIVDEWVHAEPGWSLLSGALGSILLAVCAYLYMAATKRKRFRQRSMRRRRQMQTAIMSSCKQEVALAIRAKMTVI
ncbi:unnamed protein product [Anisakis simplex]|uniref:Uncharacterized protein n=1 Tax=Anisakis simplex TaxID=6269 RepID=A0A0M3K2H2_ANISI|nr:unnamed protein product [Anisakis simplex]